MKSNMIARLSLESKLESDWRAFREIYYGPLVKSAWLAGFSRDESKEIIQEILVHMTRQGFQCFIAQQNESLSEYLSKTAHKCWQKARRRRAFQKKEKSVDLKLVLRDLPARAWIENFLCQQVTQRILEAFIERAVFSETVVLSTHAFLVGLAVFEEGQDAGRQRELVRSIPEIYSAVTRALMIAQNEVDRGASLDEAMQKIEMYKPAENSLQ